MSRSDIENAGRAGASNDNVAKILDDFYLYTDSNELSVGRWLSSSGYWESWITSWFTKNINPGDRCIDIGANYGYYTRIMERLSGPNGEVFSIEANSSLSNLITKSIEDYPMEDGSVVEVIDVALSDKVGKDTLSISEKYLGGSSIIYGKNKLDSSIEKSIWDREIEVDTNILDNLVEGHINIIKIDIEGAEPLAWPGMKKTLENTDVIVVECGGYSPKDFIDNIFSNYKVSVIDIYGEEIAVTRRDFDSYKDLVMAVLRKKNV